MRCNKIASLTVRAMALQADVNLSGNSVRKRGVSDACGKDGAGLSVVSAHADSDSDEDL